MAPVCSRMMSRFLCAVVLGAASGRALSLVNVDGPVQHVPAAWHVSGATPHSEVLELTFAVKQQGLAELEDTVLRVSTPSSPDYGQHLSNEEVQRLTAPRPEHLEAVEAFIRSHGLEPKHASPNGDFITVVASVRTAEAMLSTRYVDLVHKSGVQVSRALDGYKLPDHVAEAVDFVMPTTHIPGVQAPQGPDKQELQSEYGAQFGIFNSPANLRQLYSVGDALGKADDNKQAVTAFLNQNYGEGSLKAFWGLYCRNLTCGKGLPKLVGDHTTGLLPGVESMLDIETITGLAGNIESEFWGFGGKSPDNPQNEPFMKWLTQLSSTSDKDVPKIFSTSYGEDEGSWHPAAAQRLNAEFQKAGARGISLLFASGDNGPNCESGKFTPNGPASSPWVTAVGGTSQGKTWPKPGPDAEAGVGLSSGGFSNYWAMPDWQKDAVAGYLKQPGLPDKSKVGYNTTGRAFPDISAQAVAFFVYAGIPQPGVSGTSCASPTAAAVFSLLNDLRLQQGKSTLGFLNPFIYQHASAFNDVTTGGSRSSCGEWPAKAGWDAATGVGTPNYENLAKVVSQLPAGRAPGAVSTVVV